MDVEFSVVHEALKLLSFTSTLRQENAASQAHDNSDHPYWKSLRIGASFLREMRFELIQPIRKVVVLEQIRCDIRW